MAGFIMFISVGCGGSPTDGGVTPDSTAEADLLAKADVPTDVIRADSLRRDSLMRDSIEEAHALRLTDFISLGTGVPVYAAEQEIVNRLKAKGFAIEKSDRVSASYDATDPDGTNFREVTNYRFVSEGDSAGTNVAIKWSETYWPVTINFADDRQLGLFMTSLEEAGFAKDGTGNYSHRGNTSVAGVSIVCSRRRVVIERIWSY